MASPSDVVLCALAATAFWSLLGYAIGRHLLPNALATGAAPVIGWGVHNAVALPLFGLIGFSQAVVVAFALLCAVVSGLLILVLPKGSEAEPDPAIPVWAFALAAVLALIPAAAILPKISGDAVYLADPIFDHSKIAIIDAMTRQGLPPVNPVFGEGRLAYYYLWHFSAAQLALALRVSGWEADIALTWFTAFASLSVMMGLSSWLGKRSAAAIFVVILAAAASLRVMLGWIFGSSTLVLFLLSPTGFAGWLFQVSWAPQHVMAASCVVTAMLLLIRYSQRQSSPVLLTLVLIVVAGFESSTYVGGITFAVAALAAGPVLIVGTEPARRIRFITGLAAAAVLVVGFAAQFLLDQSAAVTARGGGPTIVVDHFEVLGEMFPIVLRRLLDVPAYWLILLPIEFPAAYIAGVIALAVIRRRAVSPSQKCAVTVCACFAGASLIASWLLVSKVGDNNDLGWRAVLPAVMILIAAAAAGCVLLPRRAVIVAAAAGGLTLSLPDTAHLIRVDIMGTAVPDGGAFAQAPALWKAVRQYTEPAARVANNPLYLQDLTPWPANMSWALLANRSSCFAGRELALTFAPLPVKRREAINEQFIRVFDGQGTPDDVVEMAKKYRCDVVVVVPQDKAWNNDPFASSPDYRLVENRNEQWRIYMLAAPDPTAR